MIKIRTDRYDLRVGDRVGTPSAGRSGGGGGWGAAMAWLRERGGARRSGRSMTAVSVFRAWNEYEATRLEGDTRLLQEAVDGLTAPTPPEDAWRDIAAVAARYATAQGVGVKTFFAHIADAIVTERQGEVDPVIATLDELLEKE
jgi:hypothetical protein